jgi:hypothetical protein
MPNGKERVRAKAIPRSLDLWGAENEVDACAFAYHRSCRVLYPSPLDLLTKFQSGFPRQHIFGNLLGAALRRGHFYF